jgi:GntR family transcriptional regulator, transcriptional repressor for pyruvate dehydrogenase complex
MIMITEKNKKIQKLAPVRIFEQAVEQIRKLIEDGILVIGEKLPTEQALCEQLNVSRSSVREALRVLEAEGLVEVKRGSGTYVVQNRSTKNAPNELAHWLEQREETLEQVLEIRGSIEGLTASLAAVRANEETLANIEAILEKQSQVIRELSNTGVECFDVLAQLDAAFHIAISSASGNDIAGEIISHILPAFNESNKAVLYLCHRAGSIEVEHRKIMDALIARDPIAAEKAMREHILQVRNEILTFKDPDRHASKENVTEQSSIIGQS